MISGASLAGVFAVAFSGCIQQRDSRSEEGRADMQSTTPRIDSVALRRFPDSVAAFYRNNSGLRDSMVVVVRDAVAWEHTWRRLTARHSPALSPPAIDFGKEMAVVVALGERPSGGYAIRIQTLVDRGNYIDARVQRRAPGRGCGVTGMVTAPVDVVVTPRLDRDVRATVQDTVAQCGPS